MISAPFGGDGGFFILNNEYKILYVSELAKSHKYKIGQVVRFATIPLEEDVDNLKKDFPKETEKLIQKYPEWFI